VFTFLRNGQSFSSIVPSKKISIGRMVEVSESLSGAYIFEIALTGDCGDGTRPLIISMLNPRIEY